VKKILVSFLLLYATANMGCGILEGPRQEFVTPLGHKIKFRVQAPANVWSRSIASETSGLVTKVNRGSFCEATVHEWRDVSVSPFTLPKNRGGWFSANSPTKDFVRWGSGNYGVSHTMNDAVVFFLKSGAVVSLTQSCPTECVEVYSAEYKGSTRSFLDTALVEEKTDR
jgi:hypothetical protein